MHCCLCIKHREKILHGKIKLKIQQVDWHPAVYTYRLAKKSAKSLGFKDCIRKRKALFEDYKMQNKDF